MQRREFLKQACGAGMCGCVLAALLSSTAHAGDEPASEAKPDAKPAEDGRIKFAQDRYAKLLAAFSQRAEPAVVSAALGEVGEYCASEFKVPATFAGKPDEFLAFIREKWHGDASYDAETKIVTVAFPAMSECPCPLVKKGVTPATMCECSVGWQKHAFGAVFGRPVEARLKGSILRGDDRCSFEIRVT